MNLGKETEYIEFKRSLSETKEGLCSISAMLNKHHKETLYFGVKDNGDVVGQDIGKDTLNKLSRNVSEFIRPAVYYEVEQKNTQEGVSFIEVVFHGEHTPEQRRQCIIFEKWSSPAETGDLCGRDPADRSESGCFFWKYL